MRRLLAFSLFIALASDVRADTFNLFQPANGVLVGNTSTYVTTAATFSDIIATFNTSASCTSPSTQFLRADGICATPPGTGGGTVNSVSLTAPASLLAVAGSPVTSTGTLALSLATGQAATEVWGTDGSGNVSLFALTGAYVPPINLASTANGGITGTLGVAHGGSGAVTLTAHGVLVGEGTSAITGLTALSADNVLMGVASADPAGTAVPNCGSGTQALAYSTSTHTFSCQTISAGTGTMTSLGITLPSVFSVSGSPVTTSGTIAATFATGQTANQFLRTPNGTTGALALGSIVLPDLPPINLASSSNGGVSGNLPHTNLNSGIGASSTTCWFGDDTWKNCTSSGTVTLVGMTLPSWLSVTPASISTSGTFAVTATGGLAAAQFLATPPTTTGALSTRAIAATDLPVSITSNTSGNAATATALATNPADCASGQYANAIDASANLTCAQVAYSQISGTPTLPTGANPSAQAGPTAVNGSAATFMRSDGAPAINTSAAYTWTGNHIFNPVTGAGILVNGAPSANGINVFPEANTLGILVTGATSDGARIALTDGNAGTQSYQIRDGVAAAGTLDIFDATNVASRFQLSPNGSASFLGPLNANSSTGVALTVNGSTGSPSLVVNPAAATSGVVVVAGAGNIASIVLRGNANTGAAAGSVSQDISNNVHLANAGAASIDLDTNGVNRVAVNQSGDMTLNAPATGTVLTVNAIAASPAIFNGANSSTGAGLKIVGNFTGAGPTNLVQLSDPNNTNGVNLEMTGNGATTPNKFIRVNNGLLEVCNSAYSSCMLVMQDNGSTTFTSSGAAETVMLAAPSTFSSTLQVAANGNNSGAALILQQDSSHNATIRNLDTGSLLLGAGSANALQVFSDNGISCVGFADKGPNTFNCGTIYQNGTAVAAPTTASATWTISSGCTTTPTVAITWIISGSQVTMTLPFVSCTVSTGPSPSSIVLSGSYPTGTAPAHTHIKEAIVGAAGCSGNCGNLVLQIQSTQITYINPAGSSFSTIPTFQTCVGSGNFCDYTYQTN